MNGFLLITYFLTLWKTVALQQYRLLPTCDNSDDTNGPTVIKGDKGDHGVPGKAGPQGVQGSPGTDGLLGVPGVNGVKGSKGDVVNCSEFLQNITEKITRLEESQKKLFLSVSGQQATFCTENNISGVYTLLNGRVAVCDNGWTVFQRRFDGSISFDKNWEDYKLGFGNFNGEFWLGLEQIHQLTGNANCSLRVDLWDFNDAFAFAEYRMFRVDSERNNYALHVSGYSGTAGDSLIYHNNQQFSTRDRDNDKLSSGMCTISFNGGGWWFNNCYNSKLNGPWGRSTGEHSNIIWYHWKRYSEALKKTTMKLRCN